MEDKQPEAFDANLLFRASCVKMKSLKQNT